MRQMIPKLLTATAVSTASALVFNQYSQHPLGEYDALALEHEDVDISSFRCDQTRPRDPSDDGLLSFDDIFSGAEALDILIDRHQPLVQIPSVCYDDLGEFGKDPRWEAFEKIPETMERLYPNVYKYATVDTINQFGLVYTIQGSDKDLAPILLTAHQDVVPVEDGTLDEWDYPPFGGHYNETTGYLYGRGAAEKASMTALMSAMEALLEQDSYQPRRSVVLSFGFDESCVGDRGAAEIAKHLEKTYGEGGMAVILDEGGGGLQSLGDTLYALPAVYEKGYLDVWFDLKVMGGDSSAPPPYTSIGVMSDIVSSLQKMSFRPEIERYGPVHQGLVCQARFSPDAMPELTWAIRRGDLGRAAHILTQTSRQTQYFIQTSQSIDWVAGGQAMNSLPEFVRLGVNHRFAPQDSMEGIQHRIANLVNDVARRYNLRVEAFEDDEDYQAYLAAEGISPVRDQVENLRRPHYYDGNLVVEARKKSYVTPQSPTKGNVWDTFAGTVRYTYAQRDSDIVVAPGAMTGNTDTRHYIDLSRNIYRWSPGSSRAFSNMHTVNERLLMSEHVNMVQFYYDFIRNFDQADI